MAEKVNTKDCEQEFTTYREALHRECRFLVSVISLCRHIYEKMEDRAAELNLALCFFGFVLDAFQSVIIVWAHKLLDPEGQRGFVNFLKFIESNIQMFSLKELQRRRGYPDGHWMLNRQDVTHEAIQEDLARLSRVSSLNSISLRRNKYEGHFDRKYFFEKEQLSKDAPIKWAELDELVEVIKNIFDKYSVAYDGASYSPEPTNLYDIDRVLDTLHYWRAKKQDKTLPGNG